MNQIVAQWEDEENNRQIQFSVDYSIENGSVEIANVTPNKVLFICKESNTCIRSLGVHTVRGRRLLASQIREAGQLDLLKSEIANRQELVTA